MLNKRKKIFFLLLMSSCLLFSGCGSKKEDTSTASSQITSEAAPSTEISCPASSDLIETGDSSKPELSDLKADIIYEDENIRITADSMDADSTDTFFFAKFENLTDQQIYLSCTDAFINDFQVTPDFDLVLDKKESASYGITFSNEELNLCNISKVNTLTFRLSASDPDSLAEIFTTDWIKVECQGKSGSQDTDTDSKTSKTSDTSSGTVLYDADGIKLLLKGYTSEDGFASPLIMAVNDSKNTICVDAFTPTDAEILTGDKEITDDSVFENSTDPYTLSFSYELPGKTRVIQNLSIADVEEDDPDTDLDQEVMLDQAEEEDGDAVIVDEDQSLSELSSSELEEVYSIMEENAQAAEESTDTEDETEESYSYVECVFVITDMDSGKELGRTGTIRFDLY